MISVCISIHLCGQTEDSLSIGTLDTIPAVEVDSNSDKLDEKIAEGSTAVQDSTLAIDEELLKESVKEDSIVGFFSLFKGEPGKAALYSLVIPGGGQFYNRRWWKVPLAISADVTAVSIALYWSEQYNDYSNAYERFLAGEINSINGVVNISTMQINRDRLRQYRDYSWFAVGIVHIVTVVEAFVDRHLLEFDMNEDLTLEVIGIKDPYSVTLASVNYRF